MTTESFPVQPALLPPDCQTDDRAYLEADSGTYGEPDIGLGIAKGDAPLQPINWNLLTAAEAEAEWHDLDAWVDWLRVTYGLPPTVIPPLWHRHDELVWELSALHLHWLNSYDPEGSPSAPLAWHRDFADTRMRLREWVSVSGTRLDRDRPTRQTAWPGEPATTPAAEAVIEDREADFKRFVADDLAARRQVAERVRATP